MSAARRAARPLLAVGLCVLAAAACARSPDRDPFHQLKQAVEGYNEAFRWKNYERASAWLPPGRRPGFVSLHEDDEKSLTVDDYQVLAVDAKDDTEAAVTVRVTFTLLPDVTVQTRKLVQRWRRGDGGWWLEAEERSIRAEASSAAAPSSDPPAALPPAAPVSDAPVEPGVEGFGGEGEGAEGDGAPR